MCQFILLEKSDHEFFKLEGITYSFNPLLKLFNGLFRSFNNFTFECIFRFILKDLNSHPEVEKASLKTKKMFYVVYFYWRLGAAQSKCCLKSAFSMLFVQKTEKRKKKQKICYKISQMFFLKFAPETHFLLFLSYPHCCG